MANIIALTATLIGILSTHRHYPVLPRHVRLSQTDTLLQQCDAHRRRSEAASTSHPASQHFVRIHVTPNSYNSKQTEQALSATLRGSGVGSRRDVMALQGATSSVERVDAARRRLLKAGIYVTPVIVATALTVQNVYASGSPNGGKKGH